MGRRRVRQTQKYGHVEKAAYQSRKGAISARANSATPVLSFQALRGMKINFSCSNSGGPL